MRAAGSNPGISEHMPLAPIVAPSISCCQLAHLALTVFFLALFLHRRRHCLLPNAATPRRASTSRAAARLLCAITIDAMAANTGTCTIGRTWCVRNDAKNALTIFSFLDSELFAFRVRAPLAASTNAPAKARTAGARCAMSKVLAGDCVVSACNMAQSVSMIFSFWRCPGQFVYYCNIFSMDTIYSN